MPSKNHDTLGLSLFLIHGHKRFSHVTHESVSLDIDANSEIKTSIPLTINF